MSDQPQRKRALREIELEVEAEGRDWMRQRLEEKLQKEAERDGAVFPPQPKKGAASAREGAATKNGGRVGQGSRLVWWDPATGKWGYPIRQVWGLSSHQEMSPALEDKLAFTLTATGSYAEAAAVAQKWGCEVEDSTLHVLA